MLAASIAALSFVSRAEAETYSVGPTRTHTDLAKVAKLLKPGDVVEVDGDATYPGDLVLAQKGTPSAKITIRGLLRNGKRPLISGGRNTVEFRGDHYVFENFEVTGGTARCIFHHAHDITVRDSLVHDCVNQGILGADEDSGSLTLERIEVHHAGEGLYSHQLYIATDETAHPGSVFRMEDCYIHDGKGGNNVKSRAERNEIYSNWIEGAVYHELELIGPDGQDPGRAREDSDVVGNVIRKLTPGYAIRVGGDGTGETNGRYRFVNNTILIGPEVRAVFRLFNGLESIEMHNNLIARQAGGPVEVIFENELRWARGDERIAGTNNWLPTGSTKVPREWKGTLFGDNPGIVSWDDPRPLPKSPLVDAGASTMTMAGPPGCPFPNPLGAPSASPPLVHAKAAKGHALGRSARKLSAAIDIGAFELERTETAGARPDEPPQPRPMPPQPRPSPPPRVPPPWPGYGGCSGCAVTSEASDVWGFSPFALACVAMLRRRLRRS